VCPHPQLNPRQSQAGSLLKSCLAFVVAFLFLLPAVDARGARGSGIDDGIRIDVAVNGQLRIENRFGDVSVDVTKQKDVSVAATISGARTSNQSPVVIEKRNDLLLISVVRDARDPEVRVNLTVSIPETVRAEIVTTEGAITSHGLSASLSLNTTTGSIRAEVETPLDADVIARSIAGRVHSDLGVETESDSHDFRSRFGAGHQILRVNSQRGEIVLGSFSEPARARNPAEIPKLRSGENRAPTAGTPANQMATEEVEEGDVIRVDTELVNMNFSKETAQ